MKKVNKILLSVFAAFAMVILLKLPVDAATLSVTSRSTTEIGINWEPAFPSSGTLTGYIVEAYPNSFKVANNCLGGTLTFPNGYKGYVYIYYTYQSSFYPYNECKRLHASAYINTIPSNIQANDFGISNASLSSKQISIYVSQKVATDGFELQLYKNGKLVHSKTYSGSYANNIPVSANATYQYRVRYYTYNSQENQTYYSANWSPMRKFCLPYYTGKAKSNKKGFSLTLKKATGVSKYLVYVSKKSSKSGFKKVASVSLGKKSKKTIQIVKNYKKRARNYIRIVPVFKDGSKSEIIGTGSIYIYK